MEPFISTSHWKEVCRTSQANLQIFTKNISVLLKLYLGQQDIKNCKLSRQSTMRLLNSWLGDLTKTNPDSVMLEFRLDENRL